MNLKNKLQQLAEANKRLKEYVNKPVENNKNNNSPGSKNSIEKR